MQRRTFLKTTSASVSACLTSFLARPLMAMPQESKYIDTIGLQLWTVRDQLAEDNKKTLKAIADAGYKQVELMDVGQADDLKPICNDLGLKITSAFFDWNSICNPKNDGVPTIDSILEKAKAHDIKHIVFGYIGKGSRETTDQYKAHAVNTNAAGEKAKKLGMQMCYHNHSFEFATLEDKKSTGFQMFMDHFDKDFVKFELDVFWAKIGGWDPFDTLRKLKGRCSQVHLKDLKADTGVIVDEGNVPNDAFKECGNGTINMAEIMKVAEEIGVEQCHVEQDQSPNPIASIGTSIKHLKSLK